MYWQEYEYAAASSSSFDYRSTNSPKKPKQPNQQFRAKHTEKVEVWVCKICDKDYSSKSSLNRHFSTVHENPKPVIREAPKPPAYRAPQPVQAFTCRQCGGQYSSQGNLNRHVSTVHEKSVAKPKVNKVALSKSTKVVQKNKTNMIVNIYNPVIQNRH